MQMTWKDGVDATGELMSVNGYFIVCRVLGPCFRKRQSLNFKVRIAAYQKQGHDYVQNHQG